MFRLDPVHLHIIRKHMDKAGCRIGLRSLYRWLDRDDERVPRLDIAIVLADVLHELFDFDKLAVLRKLAKLENTSDQEK